MSDLKWVVVKLSNGRTYRHCNTDKPYVGGEYPSGGIIVSLLTINGNWFYLDNSPTYNTLIQMYDGLARLGRLK